MEMYDYSKWVEVTKSDKFREKEPIWIKVAKEYLCTGQVLNSENQAGCERPDIKRRKKYKGLNKGLEVGVGGLHRLLKEDNKETGLLRPKGFYSG